MSDIHVEIPPLPAAAEHDAALRDTLSIYQQQIAVQMRDQLQESYKRVLEDAKKEAALQFERWQGEQRREAAITAFAQRVTTPTMDRPYALPASAEQIADVLRGVGDDARAKLEAMFESFLASGLVSFQSMGSAAGGEDTSNATALFDNLVFAKIQQGMSKSAAIMAVSKERPDLYAAQTARKAGK